MNYIIEEIDNIFNKLNKKKTNGASDKELYKSVIYMLKNWKNDEIVNIGFNELSNDR